MSVNSDFKDLLRVFRAGRVRFLGDLEPALTLPEGALPEERHRFFRRGSEPFGGPLRIGSDAQWDFTPWARIDDVRIWQIARSQQAIALTMDGVQPDAVGLVANWTFGGGSLSDSVSGRTGVLAGDASVQFLPTPTPSPTPTPKPSPTPSPTPIGSPVPPGVLGDVNCDAHIGPGDVVALLAAVAAVSEPQASCEVQGAGAATSRLDVDCSGTVDALDALALLSYLAGSVVIETSFLFLTGMTAVAMTLFFAEGISARRKTQPKNNASNAKK